MTAQAAPQTTVRSSPLIPWLVVGATAVLAFLPAVAVALPLTILGRWLLPRWAGLLFVAAGLGLFLHSHQLPLPPHLTPQHLLPVWHAYAALQLAHAQAVAADPAALASPAWWLAYAAATLPAYGLPPGLCLAGVSITFRSPLGESGRHDTPRDTPAAAPLRARSVGWVERRAGALRWPVAGILGCGAITVLAAPPKRGKTVLVFSLLRALFAGEPFCGLATEPTDVVYLTEEPNETIAEKTRSWPRAARKRLHLVLYGASVGLPWADTMRQARALARRKRARVLVIDTWAQWALGEGAGAESTSTAALAAIKEVRSAAERDGLAVLLVAHSRKAGGRGGEAVRGSNALTGAVDVIGILDRPEHAPANERIVTFESRFQATPAELHCRYADGAYSLVEPESHPRQSAKAPTAPGDTPVTPTVEAGEDEGETVLAVLRAQPGLRAAQVAKAAGLGRAQTYRHLAALLSEGRVVREGDGSNRAGATPYTWSVAPGSGPALDSNQEPPTTKVGARTSPDEGALRRESVELAGKRRAPQEV